MENFKNYFLLPCQKYAGSILVPRSALQQSFCHVQVGLFMRTMLLSF